MHIEWNKGTKWDRIGNVLRHVNKYSCRKLNEAYVQANRALQLYPEHLQSLHLAILLLSAKGKWFITESLEVQIRNTPEIIKFLFHGQFFYYWFPTKGGIEIYWKYFALNQLCLYYLVTQNMLHLHEVKRHFGGKNLHCNYSRSN